MNNLSDIFKLLSITTTQMIAHIYSYFKVVLSKKPSFQSYNSPVDMCSTTFFSIAFLCRFFGLIPLLHCSGSFSQVFPWCCSRCHASQPERITRHLQTLSFGIDITYRGLVKALLPFDFINTSGHSTRSFYTSLLSVGCSP